MTCTCIRLSDRMLIARVCTFLLSAEWHFLDNLDAHLVGDHIAGKGAAADADQDPSSTKQQRCVATADAFAAAHTLARQLAGEPDCAHADEVNHREADGACQHQANLAQDRHSEEG